MLHCLDSYSKPLDRLKVEGITRVRLQISEKMLKGNSCQIFYYSVLH